MADSGAVAIFQAVSDGIGVAIATPTPSLAQLQELEDGILRLVVYPSSDPALRVNVEFALLPNCVAALGAHPVAALMGVKVLTWYLQHAAADEIKRLQEQLFFVAGPSQPPNMSCLLNLFSVDQSIDSLGNLGTLFDKLTHQLPPCSPNIGPLLQLYLTGDDDVASAVDKCISHLIRANFSPILASTIAATTCNMLNDAADDENIPQRLALVFNSVPPPHIDTFYDALAQTLRVHPTALAAFQQSILPEIVVLLQQRAAQAHCNALYDLAPAPVAAAPPIAYPSRVNDSASKDTILKVLVALYFECDKGPHAFLVSLRQNIASVSRQFLRVLDRHSFNREKFEFEDPDAVMQLLKADIAGYVHFLELCYNSKDSRSMPLAAVRSVMEEVPFMKDYSGPEGYTLLYLACRFHYIDVFRYLLSDLNCDPNFPSVKQGSTALHGACYGGHPDCVRLLLDYGANPNVANDGKETPLDNAIMGLGVPAAKNEMKAMLAYGGDTKAWEYLVGAKWQEFPTEAQHFLSSCKLRIKPFVLPSFPTLAEVDLNHFTMSTNAGETSIRWRTAVVPRDVTPLCQFMILTPSGPAAAAASAPPPSWINVSNGGQKYLVSQLEQRRSKCTLSGELHGENLVIDLTTFTVESVPSRQTGHFRWIPAPPTGTADAAAALGLVDEEESEVPTHIAVPPLPPPPPKPVVLVLHCPEPFASDLSLLLPHFRSAVELRLSSKRGEVQVVTTTHDEAVVTAEIKALEHACQFSMLHKDVIVEYAVPVITETMKRFDLSESAILSKFLLAETNGIEETILKLDSADVFRLRILSSPSTGSMSLQVKGTPMQVGAVGNMVTRLNFLVAEAQLFRTKGCNALETKTRKTLELLRSSLVAIKSDASLRPFVKFFLQEAHTRLHKALDSQKTALIAALEDFLLTQSFPHAVAAVKVTNLTQLSVNLRKLSKDKQDEHLAALEDAPIEHESLKATLAHMTQGLKCEKPGSRTILDNCLDVLLQRIPHRRCTSLWPTIVELISVASIQIDACSLNLPLYGRSPELLKIIRENDVISIRTGTGTGKSTLLPPLLVGEEYGRVAVTQPRRLPCRSVGKRVLDTFRQPLCGWVMAGEQYENQRRVLYLTDGLLREWLQACLPGNGKPAKPLDFDIVFLDEVHERGWNTDVCIGLLASLLRQWKQMGKTVKVILASATLDGDIMQPFQALAANEKSLKIGRFEFDLKAPFPVTVHHEPRANPVELAIKLFQDKDRIDQILVFLPSVADVRDAVKHFQTQTQTKAYGLYANQEAKEQKTSMEAGAVFFSTTIAETSLTFPHLRFVVDTGEINESRFDLALGIPTLGPVCAPNSTLLQRQGRLGRTKAGDYYGLYASVNPERKKFPSPQLLNTDILDVEFSLRLRGSSLRNILEFLPAKPSEDALKLAEQRLQQLGLVTSDGKLVEDIKEFPVLGGARITAATYAALTRFNCGYDMLLLAAMLRALPSDSSNFMKSIPPALKSSQDGEIFSLVNIMLKMRTEQNRDPAKFNAANFGLSQGFSGGNVRVLKFALEHFEKFELAFSNITRFKMLAQKSPRTWEPLCRSLLTGFSAFVFCSQQLLHGNKSLYSAFSMQRPTAAAVPAKGAAAAGGGAGAAPPPEVLPPDLSALLSFDSMLARKPKEDPVPWLIVLQCFYTPRQQEHLTLAMAGALNPAWADYEVSRRVPFVSDEDQMFRDGAGEVGATVVGSEVLFKGPLRSIAEQELKLYGFAKHEEKVIIRAVDYPSNKSLAENIKDLQSNRDLFNPFIWKWRNEYQVDVKLNTNTPGVIEFTVQGRKRDCVAAKKSLSTFAFFLRDTSVVTIHDSGRWPMRVPLSEQILSRLRRVTDSKYDALELWRLTKSEEATRETRMEVVARLAVCELDCRLEGGFVRDWIVRGDSKNPGTSPNKWLEWDTMRGRCEVVKGVVPCDLDMELPFKFISMESFLNKLHKLGFETESQKFGQGYNFVVDRHAPTGPFTLDLIYPHNVATHDRVDFDVNNLYCLKDFTHEFGMRVDVSSAVTLEETIQHITNKQLLVMKTLDPKGIMAERISKMEGRGWTNLGHCPLVPNRGPKFGATLLPVASLDNIYKKLVDTFKAKFSTGTICGVYQIGTHNLEILYKAMKAQIELENGGNANEAYLFHGTDAANIKSITDNGFDNRYWSSSGNHGHGAYFADDPTKANQYATKGGSKERCMFWCKVLLGKPETATAVNTSRLHPARDCHSVVYNVAGSFKEFIVYRYGQVLPYVLIRYTVT